MYSWGYVKEATLSKLDLDEQEAITQNLLDRFVYYANEAVTQICSAIKPKYKFARFDITSEDVGILKQMPEDFVSFGDDVNYMLVKSHNRCERIELHDTEFSYMGYNELIFYAPGEYYISYNARWYTFTTSITDGTILDIPADVLDCIPSYIASQCYKVDDEYKAQVFRNEYEIMLSRIDATHYKSTKTMHIEGGW